MFSTVLVANRGEIALRIMRACRELGLRTVAIYSEADKDALHVRYADDAYLIGPPSPSESYLNVETIVDVALRAHAGAVHPGYGVLSENPLFARRCVEAELVFIGPSADAMERMGGKVQARREAAMVGVPLVPGTSEPVATPDGVRELAEHLGYPIAIKAVAGGGGRGLKVATSPAAVDEAFASAKREAAAYFKNDELYVEKYLANPRHVEVQILADLHGHVLHLGERDCSVQRRHQKLIEEAPSPVLTDEQRSAMGAAAVRLAQHVGYTGAGTLEFLWEAGSFFFLEMNTRIQVEHPVTEAITGIDLVKWQIAIAQGMRLPWSQDEIRLRGHAIECRINAEDPSDGFRPSTGILSTYCEPHGLGVRVEGGYGAGLAIPPQYDSLIAKLVVWGQDRPEACARMQRALRDFHIGGVRTTIPFHRWAMADEVFARGDATVRFVEERFKPDLLPPNPDAQPSVLPAEQGELDGARAFHVEVNGRRFQVRVKEADGGQQNGRPARLSLAGRPGAKPDRGSTTTGADAIKSPMGGTVVSVKVQPGDEVAAGQVLAIVEAMKMENEIASLRAGTIQDVTVTAGASVQAGDTIATFMP